MRLDPKLTLQNLCRGKAEEIFQRDLKKLLANIDDAQVPADPPRELVLTIKFAPTKDRKYAGVLFSSKLKLPIGDAVGGGINILHRGDELVAMPEQDLDLQINKK
ncbi:MAG: hypothetical protein JWO13_2253 [Acidobacteriales bacterium]|nr:hypothetical protein [Terriglobales bacterium]